MSHQTAVLALAAALLSAPVTAIGYAVFSLIRRRLRRPEILPAPTAEAARTSQTFFANAVRTDARYL